VVQGVEEVADGARLDKGRMGAWSTTSLVSRSDEEARPERARASARSSGSCVVESLRGNGWEKDHQVHRSEAKEGEVEEGTRAHRWTSISMETQRQYCSSDERLRRPSGAIRRGKKGEEERRLRPSYRRGLPSKRQGNKGD
jgi:hypothetical protein